MPNVAFYASYGSLALKRKYHEFDVISKPKNVCLTTETKKLVARFVINYHPSERKLLTSASGQGQSRLQWIET